MHNWREGIIEAFVPKVSKLTLVADPDSLLLEENVQIELKKRGFDIVAYDDPIEFRYIYESNYRNSDTELVLLVQRREIDDMPYDLLASSRHLRFSLSELFPNLSYPIVEQLDRNYFDRLYEAYRRKSGTTMGDKATMEFILENVFEIPISLIKDRVSLLKCLLRCHYQSLEIPSVIRRYMVEVFIRNDTLSDWPIEEIVYSSEAFYAFLQKEWPKYLNTLNKEKVEERPDQYFGDSKSVVPFGHKDILVYIDNLFIERKLKPVPIPEGLSLGKKMWERCGIEEENDTEHIEQLVELVQNGIPDTSASYDQWLSFAMKWGLLSATIHTHPRQDKTKYSQLKTQINSTFLQWLKVHYASLVNIPSMRTAMVHHIPRHMARGIEDGSFSKVALIVVDGLAIDQWKTVQAVLEKDHPEWLIKEQASFAWIPTLTSVSRQAIFSGKTPNLYGESILTTAKEGKEWEQFWENSGLSKQEIAYVKNLGKGDPAADLEALILPHKTKVIGLVINTVDGVMHGMELGASGMHNQVKHWAEQGYLSGMIDVLMSKGFTVWLTSDHGNTECYGEGSPREGSIAEQRGERVRIYPTEELRDRVGKDFPFAQNWDSSALPSGFYPLIATGESAFIQKGETIVGHGGASIEEVVVPLIKFDRRV